MTVTIFNRLGEDEYGEMTYAPRVFRDVWMQTKTASNPVNSGERDNDNFLLFIFSDDGYLPPEQFRDNPTGHWTLAPGDPVAEGIAQTLPARPFRINTINPCYTKKGFHHWEVRGRGQIMES